MCRTFLRRPVPRHPGLLVFRKQLGEALGEDDGAVVLIALLALEYEIDDPIDERRDRKAPLRGLCPRERIDIGFVDREVAVHIFGREHHVGFAGDRYTVRQPTRLAAHRFDDEIAAGGDAICAQIQQLLRHHVDRREEPEREVDATVVVVDRLGQMHDVNSGFVRDVVVLILVEEVGRLESVVTADRDERIDIEGAQGAVNPAEPLGFLGIEQVCGGLDGSAGVDPRGSDDDASTVAKPANVGRGEQAIVLGLEHGASDGIVLLEVGVPVEDAEHFGASLQERNRRGKDHRVGRRCGAAGENDRNSFHPVHHAEL